MINKYPEIKYIEYGLVFNNYEKTITKHHNSWVNNILELCILSSISYKYYHGYIHVDDIAKLEKGTYSGLL